MFSHLLSVPLGAAPQTSLADWRVRHREAMRTRFEPFYAAMAVAIASDRLAWAFASGYQAALHSLISNLHPERLVALCVTEAGGGHPRDIHSSLLYDAGTPVVHGHKRFVTLGSAAELLLVVVREGEDEQGRPRLRMARVPADRVQVEDGEALPVCPEIPHASVHLDAVRLLPRELDPGDAYTQVVKPFRTVEDCFVTAAALAYVLGVGRRSGWPREALEDRLAVIAGLRELVRGDPNAPGAHVALGGLLRMAQTQLDPRDPLWEQVNEAERERFLRDVVLLQVAGRARAARLQAAWAALG